MIPHNGLLDMKGIVKNTNGLSGAYLEEIVRNAFVLALEESEYKAENAKVNQVHLESATADMIAHREKAKKDLAKRDLKLDTEDMMEIDHSFG